MSYDNVLAAHRHALHALEDFRVLARSLEHGPAIDLYASLVHSISHHLRHAAYRTGKELSPHDRREVERVA